MTEAVALIPNTNALFPGRTDYLRMGYAIKAACADDPARALELFHDWCARWEGNDRFPLGNEPETVEADWSRMHPPFSIGADWLYEKAQPFGFNAAGEDFEALEDAPASDARPQAGARPVQFSDAALALRFCKQQGADVRFVTALGRWLIWNGKCWAEDETEQAYDLAVEICSAASSEALRILPKTKAERIATRVASGSVIGKVHRIARADRLLACTPAAWDANPWILNTPAGVVDLRTSALGPHDRARHCRKITAIGPEKMPTPLWDRFLHEITSGDRELQAYLQRVAGYGLTGLVREHALFFGHGAGGNGKGVLLNTMTRIMNDYAATSAMEAFTASSYDRHSTELAMLHGARFVTARETEEGRFWAESRIKQITGGDPITARFLYRDNFTFQPAFKLFIVGNHMPKLRNVDDAIRRRVHMIPFLFKPATVNLNLEEELEPEWPGILAWMIAGCLEWQRGGLRPPSIVRAATADYFAGEDVLGRWLEERCRQHRTAFTSTQALFEDFQEWCVDSGEKAGTKIGFARALSGRGIPRAEAGDANVRGFRLTLETRPPREFSAL